MSCYNPVIIKDKASFYKKREIKASYQIKMPFYPNKTHYFNKIV